ncbi:MAG TPA: hypothetical protein VMB34_19235 [Acetobacteraceae bacterium]|nr:hypothetical protein [Acetobacteraceae bacterium]
MNPDFQSHDHPFWLLYESCRYNETVCRDRVSRAVRLENRVKFWLMISVVGAGAAGTIKLLGRLDTDAYWAAASWVGTGLAVWSLFLGNSEARQAVFERAVALQALAVEVAEARRRAILSGTEQEIADRYMELHGRLREELERLGPDHSHYADLHRKRLTRRLRASLEDEGRIRPPAAGRD